MCKGKNKEIRFVLHSSESMTETRTCKFFEAGTPNQFEWVLQHYDECLRLKAESKSSKPENVIKLDKWYQNELPKIIKSRGKDPHLNHEEIVQTIKWKLARGKFRPNLTNLVRMNTPRVVMQETRKAFRKIAKNQDLQAAIQALCNLKGVGPAMASAVLSAGAPEIAPYMADECLLSMPHVEGLDYTMREYMKYVEYIKGVQERLNAECGSDAWDPHRIELAVWTHYVASDLKPELLTDMPTPTSSKVTPAANGKEEEATGNSSSSAEEVSSNGVHQEQHSTDKDAVNSSGKEEEESGSSIPATKEDKEDEKKKVEENNKTNGDSVKTNGNSNSSPPSSVEEEKTNGTTKNSSEVLSSTDSDNTNDGSPPAMEVGSNESSNKDQNNESTAADMTSSTDSVPSNNTSQKRPLEDSNNEPDSAKEEPESKRAKENPETTTATAKTNDGGDNNAENEPQKA